MKKSYPYCLSLIFHVQQLRAIFFNESIKWKVSLQIFLLQLHANCSAESELPINKDKCSPILLGQLCWLPQAAINVLGRDKFRIFWEGYTTCLPLLDLSCYCQAVRVIRQQPFEKNCNIIAIKFRIWTGWHAI